MQRGLGGFPHERLHQDGSREFRTGNRNKNLITIRNTIIAFIFEM
ncbi:hypothetical protein [Moorena sp. SIO3H5]|nr:hypothetical protein [Moorena sp. SIO3H5]